MKACVSAALVYLTYPLITLSKTSIISLYRIQNKALRFTVEEAYPYTRNPEEVHQQVKVDQINTTIYKRSLNTKK